MTQLSGRFSKATDSTSHLHFSPSNCPTCGQEIPPDKMEEIAGRIAAREREQTLAITAQLEHKYAIDKSAIEAKATTDLETERQQSAKREQQAREEARRAADKLITERQAQVEQERTALVAGWEQRLAQSELARTAAQQTEASLQTEIIELRKETASAIDAVKAEAKEREAQIQSEAKQSAESAAAERIKQIEASHHESETALEARITVAEANRIAAEKNKSILVSQLEELQRTKDTELDKLRQEAAADLLRVRQVASDDAEVRFRDKLAAQEDAAAEANTKDTRRRDQAARVHGPAGDRARSAAEGRSATSWKRTKRTLSTPKRQRPSMKTKSFRARSPIYSEHWRTRPPKNLAKGQR